MPLIEMAWSTTHGPHGQTRRRSDLWTDGFGESSLGFIRSEDVFSQHINRWFQHDPALAFGELEEQRLAASQWI